MWPEKLSVSTVVMVVGTLNTLADLASATTLFFERLPVDRLHAERHLRLLVNDDQLAVFGGEKLEVVAHGSLP